MLLAHRAYLHVAANKKKMTSVVEKIGFSATQANILNVLGKYSWKTPGIMTPPGKLREYSWNLEPPGYILGMLPPKTSIAIISGTGKDTDFKFGWYIHRVYPTKNPFEILEKRERGCIQGLPKFFEYTLLSQERVKLRTSNFVRSFIGSIGTEAR